MRIFINLCCPRSVNRAIKSRRMRWARNVTHTEDTRNYYKILVRKPEGRPRCRWEDNNNIEEVVKWVHLPQSRDQKRSVCKRKLNS
jgi:hypothetical protein